MPGFGLTGAQGVIIPQANRGDLMLRPDVVTACEAERFHVYAVETIQQALELLTWATGGTPGPPRTISRAARSCASPWTRPVTTGGWRQPARRTALDLWANEVRQRAPPLVRQPVRQPTRDGLRVIEDAARVPGAASVLWRSGNAYVVIFLPYTAPCSTLLTRGHQLGSPSRAHQIGFVDRRRRGQRGLSHGVLQWPLWPYCAPACPRIQSHTGGLSRGRSSH